MGTTPTITLTKEQLLEIVQYYTHDEIEQLFRWKPTEGERFWYISFKLNNEIVIETAVYVRSNKRYNDMVTIGNCFKTKEELEVWIKTHYTPIDFNKGRS